MRRALAAARTIAGENTAWGHALSQLIKAGCLFELGDFDACVRTLSAAETEFGAVSMLQYRAVAQWRRGQLCGEPNAAGIMRAAEDWMLGQGVRSPRNIVGLLAPGDWENSSAARQPGASGSFSPLGLSLTAVRERLAAKFSRQP
jgi:hypothetical protein